jgi:5-methylcytosine-specific restriction endonuclease McrA
MCLVLNRNYQAVDTATWERAISLLFQGHAEVVDAEMRTYNFQDWTELSAMMKDHAAGFVNSPNIKVAIPEVIRLTMYDRIPRNDVVFTKHNIMEHYGHKCCYCGKKLKPKELNFDHVVPRSKGGLTNWGNIVTSCFPCNSRKADKTPKEAGMTLLVKPSKPKHQSLTKRLVLSLPITTKGTWQRFIDKVYWDSEIEQD